VTQPPSPADRALPAAVALELIHNFTLIHDDVEDGSETRHGRPTLWRVFGVPLAINAGDGMFVLGREHLLRLADAGVPPERVLAAIALLDEACVWLCEGQHNDLSFESRPSISVEEYEAMVAGKTAGLLGASMALGALAAGADARTIDAFGECGRWLGMAFQVQDDVLGVWGDPARTGKPVAEDIRSKKKSFPVVWALEHADTRVTDVIARAYATDAPDQAAVQSVVSALDSTGARETSTQIAESWAARALDALRALELDDDRRREIEAIADFFVHRDA
jgi:geranylgeranyl diphosphate synthase type I